MAGNPSDQVKNAGTMASFYYLGRIDAQAGVDLEAGLKRELTTMSPQDLKTEAVRCGQELQGRGKAVIDMAARLQALATAPKAP
jgi:hypothetical protein